MFSSLLGQTSPTLSTCTLATTGLNEVDAAVLASMMGLLKDRTSKRWKLGAPKEADVLLVGPEPDDKVLANWKVSGKAWVAVMRSHDARPPTEHTLPLPFRLFPLLTLLQELEQLPNVAASEAASHARDAARGQWRFANALHNVRLATAHGLWQRAGKVYLRDDACAFAADEASLDALHRGAWNAADFEESVAQPPSDCQLRPVEELTWFVGWWADGKHLAPWLSEHAHHQLRQWPDFGCLNGSQVQLRLASLLVASAWTVDALVQTRGFEREQVIRFMNAATLSGLLIESAPAPVPVSPKAGGFLSKLLTNFRARLGLREEAHGLHRRGGCDAA